MELSTNEQYMLELINRARLDPVAEAQRYGLALNAGLPPDTITGSAKQVLAPNPQLNASSRSQSEWMLSSNSFSHTGVNDSDAGQRINAAGYHFVDTWMWRENLAWAGITGEIDLDQAISIHHEGLYRSEDHRVNTFAADASEIGVSQIHGEFTVDDTAYDASLLTINFASTGQNVFITGVAYLDHDGDEFYSIGEGQEDVWFTADGITSITTTAGGYALKTGGMDNLQVQVGFGDTSIAMIQVDLTAGNAKVDLVTTTDGAQVLMLSAGTTLVSGTPDATLLGVADLFLTGNSEDNVLTGNAGGNVLNGEGGNDVLQGGGGRSNVIGSSGSNTDVLRGGDGDDILIGQSGADQLSGDNGNDILTGGGGRDTFIFVSGTDHITDFTDNVDTIMIDTDKTLAEVKALGEIVDGDAVFDFGGGDTLTLTGVTHLDVLDNDLIII